MIVYHVTSPSKYRAYLKQGYILPPVRAWTSIISAERFSKQTGRPIILRLRFPDNANKLDGHRGEAVYINTSYQLKHSNI